MLSVWSEREMVDSGGGYSSNVTMPVAVLSLPLLMVGRSIEQVKLASSAQKKKAGQSNQLLGYKPYHGV